MAANHLPNIYHRENARPPDTEAGFSVGGRQCGKTAAANHWIELALDAGHTVWVVGPNGYEVRGFGTAKDITPGDKNA